MSVPKKLSLSLAGRIRQRMLNPRYLAYCICGLLLIIVLHAVTYYTSTASNHTLPEHDYLRLDTKLSSKQIHYIDEDSDGYMWISTERGLNKFDGQHYLQYYATADTTSLQNNLVIDSKEIRNHTGTILVNTYNGSSILFPDNSLMPLTTGRASAIQYDDSLFIAISENQMAVIKVDFTKRTKSTLCKRDLVNNVISSKICQNSSIWIFSTHLAELFDIDLNLQKQVDIDNIGYMTYLRNEQECWIITSTGLVSLNLATGNVSTNPETEYVSENIAYNSVEMFSINDSVVLAKDNTCDNIKVLNLNSFENREISFADFDKTHIGYITVDSKGNIWCGSRSLGINIHYARNFAFDQNNAQSKFFDNLGITSLTHLNDGRLCVLAGRSRIFICEANGEKIQESNTSVLSSSIITHITSLSNSHVLFTSFQQVYECRIDSDGQMHKISQMTMPSNIHSIVEDNNGELWAACSDGCYQLNITKGSYKKINTLLNNANIAKVLNDNRIAFGSLADGISIIDPLTMKEKRYALPLDKPGLFSCRDMDQDADGNLWIASLGMGIFHLNLISGHVDNYRAMNMCTDVSSILTDKKSGNVWLGTLNGLSRFDPTTKQFFTFYENDGVHGNEFFERCAISDADGKFYFGSKQGLTIFNPTLVTPRLSHNLVLSNIMIGRSILNSGTHNNGYEFTTDANGNPRSLILPYDVRDVKFCLSTLNYGEYSNTPIIYRLKGYDKDWQWTQSTDVTYNMLRKGKYIFEAYTIDQNGNSLASISLPITITPAWWLSWWYCWIIYPLLFVLISAWLSLLIANAIKHRHRLHESLREKVAIRYASDMNMRFFTNMAHEFRTPLTLISGANSLLSKTGRTEDEQHAMLIIDNNITRLLKLVNQLLDFNKLEHDMMRLSVQPIHIKNTIDQIVQSFQIRFQEQGIELNVSYEDVDNVVWVDPDKYDKILSNLLSNAVKFTPKGGLVSIIVRGCGDTMTTEVADTGIGIPDNMLENIFDRYYQTTDGAMKQNATGIGLCYCKGLALLHHGTIIARHNTHAEHGASFVLTLPIIQDAYLKTELNTLTSEADTEEITNARHNENKLLDADINSKTLPETSPTVLVVDDEPEVIRFMRLILRKDYHVVTKNNATDAIAMLTDIKPDIIISDVMMLGMDGFKFCQLIKQDVAFSHIPVILLTAKVTLEERIQGLNVGADAYVTKPFEPAYLMALMKSIINNRQRIQHILVTSTSAEKLADEKELSLISNSELTETESDSATPQLSVQETEFINKLYEYMEKHLSDPKLDVDELLDIFSMSRSKLFYKIKGLTGESPNAFFKIYKLNRAAEMIKQGEDKLTYIGEITGFCSSSHFATSFKKQFGILPSEYK